MRPLTFGVLVSVGSYAPLTASEQGSAGSPREADAWVGREAMADLRSGTDLCGALRGLGHAAVPLTVDGSLEGALRSHDVDACLLALHGRLGGSGRVHERLTALGMPFVGPGAWEIRRAYDKAAARRVLGRSNVPTPAHLVLGRGVTHDDRALERLGWPCYVKPLRGSHGHGVTAPTEVEDVSEALRLALELDTRVLLDRAIRGMEVQVVVHGERVLGSAEVLDEAELRGTICPPRLSRTRLAGIERMAAHAVRSLGLTEGLTRVDVLVTDRHNEVVLEVEPLPVVHRESVVARVAAAAGLAYEELVADLLGRIVLHEVRHHAPAYAVLQ